MQDFDIVVVSYNTKQKLAQCIGSILKYSPKSHLIIVDNNSTDGSKEFLEKLVKVESNITTILNTKNVGYGTACNLGAVKGKSKYIGFFNADTEVVENWFTPIKNIFEEDSKIAVVSPKMINECGKIVHAGVIKGIIANEPKRINRGWMQVDEVDIYNEHILDCPTVCGAIFFVRREIFKEVGGFNEKYFHFYEESLSGKRCIIIKQGRKVDVISLKKLHKLSKKYKNIYTLSANNALKPVWTKVLKTIRRKSKHKNMLLVGSSKGYSVVTSDHSLIELKDNVLVSVKPKDTKGLLVLDKMPLLQKKNKVTLIKSKDVYLIEKSKYHLKYVNRILNVFEKQSDLKALCALIGAYISEGYVTVVKGKYSYQYRFGICSTDKKWLKKLKVVIKGVCPDLKIGSSGYGTKSKKECFELVGTSKLLFKIFKKYCGKGSRQKKIPSFMYTLDLKYQKVFLKYLLDGDGYRGKTSKLNTEEYAKKYFGYTTCSLKLASGLSFLLKCMGYKVSIYYNIKRESYDVKIRTKHGYREVFKVRKVRHEKYVYDIATKNGIFLDACGQVLVHNTQLCFDIRKKGHRVVYTGDVTMRHYHDKSPKTLEQKIEWLRKSKAIFESKYPGQG